MVFVLQLLKKQANKTEPKSMQGRDNKWQLSNVVFRSDNSCGIKRIAVNQRPTSSFREWLKD